MLLDWGIEQKVHGFVSDSGANVYAALKQFKESITLPCAAHRLNLCVNDLLHERKIKQTSQASTQVPNATPKARGGTSSRGGANGNANRDSSNGTIFARG